MMREIKFRGYDIDTKKWYYGGYVKFNKVTLCMATEKEVKENEEHLILFQGFSDWNLPAPKHMADVVADSIGQFTGMYDKNKKEVYENDIIKISWNCGDETIETVTYCENEFGFNYGNNSLMELTHKMIEVIGNIYENKELLKGETK